MDSLRIVKLIAQNHTRGNYGQDVVVETDSTVYGEIGGITRNEWTAANSIGINPSFRVIVYTFEYNGEPIVEVDGKRYAVYRSYIQIGSDKTELYLEARKGISNAGEEIEEIDVESYVRVYKALSASGIPTYYGNVPEDVRLPYITYEMDSNNFNADDTVYSEGFEIRISLYTAKKSLKCERLVQSALNAAKLPWERGETDDLDERVYIQDYSATLLGGE